MVVDWLHLGTACSNKTELLIMIWYVRTNNVKQIKKGGHWSVLYSKHTSTYYSELPASPQLCNPDNVQTNNLHLQQIKLVLLISVWFVETITTNNWMNKISNNRDKLALSRHWKLSYYIHNGHIPWTFHDLTTSPTVF